MKLSPCLIRGDVVLTRFPLTDGSHVRIRPALVLMDQTGADVVLAFISANTQQGRSVRTDVVIGPELSDFASSGLKSPSLVHLNKIETLGAAATVIRKLGHLGADSQAAIDHCLRLLLVLSAR